MRGACPHADVAACTCGELHLLAALAPAAQWAGLAAIQLQRWASLRAARAAANPNPDPSQSRDEDVARESAEWAGCTALAQVGSLLRVLARVGNAAASPAAGDPRRQVHFYPWLLGAPGCWVARGVGWPVHCLLWWWPSAAHTAFPMKGKKMST